jgi:hypothetical protein
VPVSANTKLAMLAVNGLVVLTLAGLWWWNESHAPPPRTGVSPQLEAAIQEEAKEIVWGAHEGPPMGGVFLDAGARPTALNFVSEGRTYLSLKSTGEVVIPADVPPDEASRQFWAAVQQMAPEFCRQPAAAP